MAITTSELVWYRSKNMNDTATNGGVLSVSPISTGVKNNIFPDVSLADRTAGVTNYRKIFMKVDNSANLDLISAYVFLEALTAGDDSVTAFAGTQIDTQFDITGSEPLYGAAKLNADITALDTTISVLLEDGTVTIFRDGDRVRISNQPDLVTTGQTEYGIIAVGGVAITGNVATLTLVSTITGSYLASNSKVSSMMAVGDVASSVGTLTVNAVGTGAYDALLNPITTENMAAVHEDWTLTFTSSTAFDVVGATLGVIGGGNTTSGVSINNPDYGLPYFSMVSNGFTGVFTSGDTITFTSTPAAQPVWLKRVVPPLAGSLAGNSMVIAVEGESA